MRQQRRRLAMLAIVLGLAGAVVVAHSAMGHDDHIGDLGEAVVMCLAVAETAVVAVGAALALGARLCRPLWLVVQLPDPEPRFTPAPASVPSRAGPVLQV